MRSSSKVEYVGHGWARAVLRLRPDQLGGRNPTTSLGKTESLSKKGSQKGIPILF